MVSLGTLSIFIDGDASGWIATVGIVDKSLASLVKTAQSKLQALVSAFNGLTGAQKGLVGVGIGIGLFATALAAAAGPAIRFEAAFTGVRKTVDATAPELERIRRGLIDLSSVMPSTAVDLAGIAENAGQLGIEAGSVLRFTEVVAKLGTTTNLTFDAAAKSLARFINITGSSQADVDKLANVLVHLGNNAATTEGEILSFALRTAAASTVAGASEQDILALSSSFSSLGLRAEAGGNSLGRVFTVLSDSAKTGNKNLQLFADIAGVTAEEMQRMIEANPTDALIEVGYGLGRINDAGQPVQSLFQELGLGGIRTSEVLRQLAINTDLFVYQLGLARGAYSDGTQLNDEYAKRLQDVSTKLQIAKNAVIAFAIEMATPALGFFATSLDVISAAVREMTRSLGPAAGELGVLLLNLVKGFSQIGGAALLLVGGVDGAVTILRALGIAVEVAADTLNSLPSYVLAAVAAITILSTVVGGAAIKTFAANVLASVTSMTALTAGASGARTALVGMFSSISPLTAGLAILAAGLGIMAYQSAQVEQATEKATGGLRRLLDDAVAEQSAKKVNSAVQSMERSVATLDTQVNASRSGWQRYLDSLADTGVFRFIDLNAGMTQAVAQTVALQAAMARPEVANFRDNVVRLSEEFGINRSRVASAIDTYGAFNLATQGSAQAYAQLSAAVELSINNTDSLNESLGRNTGILGESKTTIADFAAALQVTEAGLASIDAVVDDFSVYDVFQVDDPELAAEAEAAFAAVRDRAYELATALNDGEGATTAQTDAMLAQIEATDRLVDSYDRLSAAMSAADSAREALLFQEENLAAATENLTAANDAFNESQTEQNFRAWADAAFEYEKAVLASGGGVKEFERAQTLLADSLVNARIEMGYTREEAVDYVSRLLDIPPDVVTQLILEADAAKAEAQAAEERIDAAAKEREAKITLLRLGVTDEALDAIVTKLQNLDGTYTAQTDFTWAAGAQEELAIIRAAADEIEGSDPVISVGVEYSQSAQDEMNLIRQAIAEVDSAEPTANALLDTSSFETSAQYITSEATRIDSLRPIPTVGADITDALAQFGRAEAGGDAYAGGDYTADLDADSTNAAAAQLGAIALLTAYKFADYTATLNADPRPAQAQIRYTAALAGQFAGVYVAVLQAVDAGASSTISRLISLLGSYRSKTITLTTLSKSVTQGANGMLLDGRGAMSFADGGFAGAVPARSGTAQIYSPTYPGRFHSEPETGGEAYIPMGLAKRARSLRIWEEVGRRFGQFADGAIAAQVQRAPAVRTATTAALSVSMPVAVYGATGMDEAQLARVVGAEVKSSLRAVTRELANREVR